MNEYTEVYRKPDGMRALVPTSDLGLYEELGFTRTPPPWGADVVGEAAPAITLTDVTSVVTGADTPDDRGVEVVGDAGEGTVEQEDTPVLFRDYPVTADGWVHKVAANRYFVELEHKFSTRNVEVDVISHEGEGELPIIKSFPISLSKVKVEVAAVPDTRFTGVLRVIAT